MSRLGRLEFVPGCYVEIPIRPETFERFVIMDVEMAVHRQVADHETTNEVIGVIAATSEAQVGLRRIHGSSESSVAAVRNGRDARQSIILEVPRMPSAAAGPGAHVRGLSRAVLGAVVNLDRRICSENDSRHIRVPWHV